ncbi:MAG: tryptophan 2,3-dioxygenase family protein [Cytophagales bacterium]
MDDQNEIIKMLQEKYENLGQDLNVALKGLYHSTPMTYWDYIQTDALLSLQIQRSDKPDEMVFIIYHQINELLFKMILWEIDQVSNHPEVSTKFFADRLDRISRYFDMLTSSFSIMRQGMEREQYLQFRDTLAPASGFQSAQYRMIEFGSTELINLIDSRFRKTIDRNTPFEYAYEHLYWQAAGKDYATGDKSTLLRLFQNRYMEDFITYMKKYNNSNLWTLFKLLPEEDRNNLKLQNAMRHYDFTVNVKWVMSHYKAAAKYLENGKEAIAATGGSEWKKYMHPSFQKRIFFPGLWSEEEIKNWGKGQLDNCRVLNEAIEIVDRIV